MMIQERLAKLRSLPTREDRLLYIYRLVRDEQIEMATFAYLIEYFFEEKSDG